MRIIILGAGVGGLSAAHRLADHAEIEVYEAKSLVGGLARTETVDGPESSICNTTSVSWRVYFHFYTYLFSIMKEIISYDGRSVYDHLVPYKNVFIPETNIADELTWYQKFIIAKNVCSSVDRINSLDKYTWYDYLGKDKLSIAPWLGLDRYKASVTSVHIIGLEQELREPYLDNYVLDGPSNVVWFDPWQKYLEQKGVKFYLNTPITRIETVGKRITKVYAGTKEIVGDIFILGLPVEVLAKLCPSLFPTVPLLSQLAYQIQLEFQLHLPNYVSFGDKINSFLLRDNPWGLIVENKTYSWEKSIVEQCETAQWSITVCQADQPGPLLNKPMIDCTEEECHQEILFQMTSNVALMEYLQKKNPSKDLFKDVYWSPVISSYKLPISQNPPDDPKYSNNSNCKKLRPSYLVGENVYLSTAYTDETIDVFSMEAASISGHFVASDILAKDRPVLPPRPYPWLNILRAFDKILFAVGLPDAITVLLVLVLLFLLFIVYMTIKNDISLKR